MSYQAHLTRPIITAVNGMASTGHPLASQAALGVLQRGGNAMDAAIAASAVLSVVDPAASGVGGDVFYTYFDAATGQLEMLNGCGRTASSMDPEQFRKGIPNFGSQTPTVPGVVQGWEDAASRHGTLALGELLAPAIAYARDGFAVSPRVAGAFKRKKALLEQCQTVVDTYCANGSWPVHGDILPLPDLANTLKLIAESGAASFYTGEIADRIVSGLERDGGLLSKDDFAAYCSAIDVPLMGSYRGYDIAVQQPPTMAALLLQQLKIVEAMSDGKAAWDSADWLHLLIEAKKASFADLDVYLTDPSFTKMTPEPFLSKDYIESRCREMSTQTAALYQPGSVTSTMSHTTYLTVADSKGNVVSWIQSVFNEFGSCWMAPGTGFLMNNRMFGFSPDPKHINCLEAGKRTAHTLLAPIVLKNGKPVLALGTPGDYGQTQTNLQMITNFIDHGMDVQATIDAPRWRSLEGLEVAIESRFPTATIEELSRRGHQMQVMEPWTDLMGGSQAIAINPRTGVFEGGADPRREGYAIGW